MDQQPSKRRGRPRKAIPDDQVAGQATADIQAQPGDGATGERAIEAPADVDGKSQTNRRLVSLEEMYEVVRSEARQVVRMWHPNRIDSLIQAKNGSGIEVNTGAARYQLSTGEVIEV